MAIHQFYKWTVDISNYEYRAIPLEVRDYDKSLERSLITSTERCRKELKWKDMWTVAEAVWRIEHGYGFYVFRPKNQIKGWLWLAPDGELKNWWIAKGFRDKGWIRQLIFRGLNEAKKLRYPAVTVRIDTWNIPSQTAWKWILDRINCTFKLETVEEEYRTRNQIPKWEN